MKTKIPQKLFTPPRPPKPKFITCDCESHAISVTYEPTEKGTWLSFWEEGLSEHKSVSIWKKLKLAWWFLKDGTINTDMLILNYEEVNKLIGLLEEARDATRYVWDSEKEDWVVEG